MKQKHYNMLMFPIMLVFIIGLGSFLIGLVLLFFTPVLPIVVLAFPMSFINDGTGKIHWTQKPYLWYFNNVWLKALDFLNIKNPL